MASLAASAFQRVRPALRLTTSSRVFVRNSITGQLTSGSLNTPDMGILGKERRRNWMTVADLISKVEQAMIKGFRLRKGGRTYAALQSEAESLRTENDDLTNEIDELKLVRQKLVAEVKVEEEDIIDVTKQIQEIDFKLAELRNKHLHNIDNVGSLKIAMSHIHKTGEVLALVDEVDELLDIGGAAIDDRSQSEKISRLLDSLQNEYNKVSPKIADYGKAREKLAEELEGLENNSRKLGNAPQLVDNLLQQISAKILQDRRITAQLDRLRQLQIMNSNLIGRLERSKATLARYAEINQLRADGDVAGIDAKVRELYRDLERLRISIQDIESRLDAHAQEGTETIASLRSLTETLAPAMRELLFGNIRQEGQWKTQLAILRGKKLRTLRFIGLLKAALPK